MYNIHKYHYTTREKLQEYIDKLASKELKDSSADCFIKLTSSGIRSLEGIRFPEVIQCYNPYVRGLSDHTLMKLRLDDNDIKTLDGVVFPPKLAELQLQNNKITSLDGFVCPSGLVSLDLYNNDITSFAGMQFPLSLLNLKLAGNPIDVQTVSELKNPSPFVIREIVAAFPETGPHFQRMEEMKEQQLEQLRTMMSQLKPMIEERKETVPAFSATTEQGETHSVPFIPEKTVQWAIEHLSEGPLSGKCINMKLFYNSKQLDPSKTLTDSGIDENSNLFNQCDGPKGGRKKRSNKTRRCGRGRIHRQKSAKNR